MFLLEDNSKLTIDFKVLMTLSVKEEAVWLWVELSTMCKRLPDWVMIVFQYYKNNIRIIGIDKSGPYQLINPVWKTPGKG